MADRYLCFTGTAPGRFPTRRLGLPQPAELRRRSAEQLPADVAETTARLAHPPSGAVDGQIVRLCGQSLLGA
ncbi:hypothetical protein H4K36_21660 [Streptomyces sp. DHE7-1]|nr:hypothetical protein [Streptomyces sp. DHE7-1]